MCLCACCSPCRARSEIVVYTTIAVVYRENPHDDATAQRNSAPMSTGTASARRNVAMSASAAGADSDTSGAKLSERAQSCSAMDAHHRQWRPIANGAWAQIHIFLELDRAGSESAERQASLSLASTTSACRKSRSRLSSSSRSSRKALATRSVLKNFRIVAWVLDTGKVIVNDVLVRGCTWEGVDDPVFRRFTGLDGQVYGFGFRTATQAAECSRIVHQILSNVKGACAFV